MILSELVEVRVNPNNVNRYESLGYEIPVKNSAKSTRSNTGRKWVYDFRKTIMVNVKDLPNGSPAKVEILCDMCKENKMTVSYETYNRVVKKTGSYVCQKCSREKMEQTMEERYGVKYALQNESFLNTFKNTCEKRYGSDYRKLFAEKAFESFYENTGYHYPSQSPEMRAKTTNTLIGHYGVDSPAKSQKVRQKMVQTLYANSS